MCNLFVSSTYGKLMRKVVRARWCEHLHSNTDQQRVPWASPPPGCERSRVQGEYTKIHSGARGKLPTPSSKKVAPGLANGPIVS